MSLNDQLAELEELHRMQLVAISVAAGCNTPESSEKQSIGRDNPYWSVAYSDVRAAVDREIKLLAQLAAYQAELPEEPPAVKFARTCKHANSLSGEVVSYIDSLRAAYAGLKVEAAINMENFKVTNQAYVQMDKRRLAAESTVAELRAKVEAQADRIGAIVRAYDSYRARGVMPAPDAYADMVLAINSARSEGGGA